MITETGVLKCTEVERIRVRRYERRQLKASSQRVPLYRVRYQIDRNDAREVEVVEPVPLYLVSDIRGSKLGDSVEVRLSDDGLRLLAWNNLTAQYLLDQMGQTWGESD